MRWGRGPEMLSIPWSFLPGLSTVGIFTLEYSEERVREVNWLCLYLCSLSEEKQVCVCVWGGLPHRPEGSFMPGVCVGNQGILSNPSGTPYCQLPPLKHKTGGGLWWAGQRVHVFSPFFLAP